MKYDFRRLKETREQKLLTKTELAALTGLAVSTIYRVECGTAPWIKSIRRIAAVLGVENVVLSNGRRKSA